MEIQVFGICMLRMSGGCHSKFNQMYLQFKDSSLNICDLPFLTPSLLTMPPLARSYPFPFCQSVDVNTFYYRLISDRMARIITLLIHTLR